MYNEIEETKILSEPILYAFKFYLQKVIKTFFNQNFMIDFVKEQPDNKLTREILIKNKETSMSIEKGLKLLQAFKG